MTEIPEAKCVGRSELYPRSSSPASIDSHDQLRDTWRRKLDLAYKDGISDQQTHDTNSRVGSPAETLDDLNEEAYDFKLFSQKPSQATISAPQPPRVLLRSPSPEVKDPAFVYQTRSHKFYFTGIITPEQMARFQDAAIEGQDVLRESQTKWPGLMLPWRVTTIAFSAAKRANAVSSTTAAVEVGKRRKPGKKRRIIIRSKAQARKEREEATRLAEAEKATIAMEKRSRRNREKKLKRREKARNQKKVYQRLFKSQKHSLSWTKHLVPRHTHKVEWLAYNATPSIRDLYLSKISSLIGPGNGINICCDLGRTPGECCKNGSELMNREPPISSITAGPPRATASSNIEDDDPSLPTSTSSGTLTLTLRKTVTSSRSSLSSTSLLGPSSLSVNSSSANTQTSDIPPATGNHSNLGAGLGGGLGGAAALLIGIAVFIFYRRRQKPSIESNVKYHEMDAHDSTYQHNSMLFPAELTNEDSKTSMEPAELSPKTAPAFGPYELPGGDEAVGAAQVPVASSNNVENSHQEKPKLGDTTTVSELSGLQDTEVKVRRPLAQKRPDSHSSGPWHDNL
ncbi:MAG: hypothetical protein Q9213_002675 [Squamulea squamosa]